MTNIGSHLGSHIGAAILIGALATGCSSTSAPSAAPYGSTTSSVAASTADAKPAGPAITISGMAFGAPITVSPGATITIVNADKAEHSVTSEPTGSFDTDVEGGTQKTFTAPTQPGEYAFHCTYHPSMKGTLIVK